MKTKRSGYAQQSGQNSKKKQTTTEKMVTNVDVDPSKKQTDECNGCCSITWKPATVSR